MRWLGLILATMVSGCGLLTPQLKSDALDYNDAIEDTSDKLLLRNILRARDKAPMHFGDIPLIHESLQLTSSLQSQILYGPIGKNTGRDFLTPNVGFQATPSFDINNLDTKDFVTGIASPIDAKYVKYWLDRGLDKRIIMLLFFSSAELIDQSGPNPVAVRVSNAPLTTINDPVNRSDPSTCHAEDQFSHYLSLINTIRDFTANAYTERRVLAQGFSLPIAKTLKDVAAIDPSKLLLSARANKTYNLYATGADQKLALCYYRQDKDKAQRATPAPATEQKGVSDKDVCTQSTVDIDPADPEKPPTKNPTHLDKSDSRYCAVLDKFSTEQDQDNKKIKLRFSIRSVGEMIQFLGDLLAYEDRMLDLKKQSEQDPGIAKRFPLEHHNPLTTLGYCPGQSNTGKTCRGGTEGGFLFQLVRLTSEPRFYLDYRGRRYVVNGFSPDDHTLEVLAVVNQLVNLNKSATDLKSTPFVQVLP